MDIVDPRVEDYMRTLLTRHHEPVLVEMEAEAEERGFPIIGRLVGAAVEVLARSIGAKRVFVLGSGYGYSAYWFSPAAPSPPSPVGPARAPSPFHPGRCSSTVGTGPHSMRDGGGTSSGVGRAARRLGS